MAKSLNDLVYDAALEYIADNGGQMNICSSEPTTYAEATSTYNLADVSMTVGDGNGDYTIGNGDTSGRKLAVSEKAAVTIDSTGTATHLAIVDTSNSRLLAVTTSNSQSVVATNTVTIPGFDIELADPT
tara:strand:+ start:113 stop:499 length:387 start_codon:yes stop_codon:yes gene_type:complete